MNVNPEKIEAIVEEAMRVAATCPDTPPDSGFGYDFGEELVTVPYAGDERPIPRAARQVSRFMLSLPA